MSKALMLPSPQDGNIDDTKWQMETVCKDVDKGGTTQDNVTPTSLRIIVLSAHKIFCEQNYYVSVY